jgi:hypothetical protein
MSWTLALLVILLLAGLPVAVWLDLSNLADNNLRRQASDLNSIISSVRGYYASNVVGRILAAPGTTTKVVHDYENVPGAIPIPATLSLEPAKSSASSSTTSPIGSCRIFRSPTARRIRSTPSRPTRCIVCAKIRARS